MPPENATLKVPLTNPEIWSRMSNQLRTSNLSFINIQRNIQNATIAISHVADQILQKNDQLDVKRVLHTTLDAVALLGHTANRLSVLRRTNIRPALSEEYSEILVRNTEAYVNSNSLGLIISLGKIWQKAQPKLEKGTP